MADEGAKERKILIGVLSGFCVVIAALIVAVIVANVSNGRSEPEAQTAEEEAIERRETLGEITAAAQALEINEAETYLDEKIEEYKNTDLEFDLVLTKIYILANSGFMTEALAAAEEVDAEGLSGENLMNYYLAMRTIYDYLGDNDLTNYYQDLYVQKYLEIYNGGFVG